MSGREPTAFLSSPLDEYVPARAQGRPSGPPLAQALVIGARAFSRSVLTHQLRQMGIVQVRHAARYFDAKRTLENGRFDLVILDDDLGLRGENGQSLIDDLRRCGLMDMQTIVVLTAAAATYSQVTEAAEAGVDSYLLSPFSLAMLQQRVQMSVRRREAMANIYAALRRRDWDTALEACLFKFAQRAPFWLYAARIAAEIYILRGKAPQAQSLYEEIVRHEALPWARLGVGRALLEQGKHESALQQLEAVMADHAELTDAYDLMGRAHLEMGDPDRALAVYRLAVQATPASVSRLQRLGFAAYYAGDLATAVQMLERSVRYGFGSKSFDPQAFFILALQYSLGRQHDDLRALERRLHAFAESPVHDPRRLEALANAVAALAHWARGDHREARAYADLLVAASDDPAFDFDSACSAVQLLALMAAAGQAREADAARLDRIGLRFAHSRLASQWLARSAEAHAPYAAALAGAHDRAFRLAQDIVKRSLDGDVQAAAADLVDLAESVLNARIIEMAERLLERHALRIADCAGLMQRIERIKELNDPVQLRRNPTNRQLRHPGGISLLARLS